MEATDNSAKHAYTTSEIRTLEKRAVESGIPEFTLMQHAAQGAFVSLKKYFPKTPDITFFLGGGNNGGDGLVLATLCHQAGMRVRLIALCSESDWKGAAKQAYEKCKSLRLAIEPYHADIQIKASIIVDALLGIGLKGKVHGDYVKAIRQINRAGVDVLSMDIPSGLDADTGAVRGICVDATHTVTFIGLKPGLLTGYGPDVVGGISLHTLQLPEKIYTSVKPKIRMLHKEAIEVALPLRKRTAHKGKFGHVLIIGGDEGMGGAVILAAESALRTGAGLVSVITHPVNVSAVLSRRPEVMVKGMRTIRGLKTLLDRMSVIALGPGLGQMAWGKHLFGALIRDKRPMIVDADALNLLAKRRDIKKEDWVLTPHPAEAARLLNTEAHDIQQDRFAAAKALSERYHATVVLKGAGTVVYDAKTSYSLCPYGNPGMATGGMGDALTGVIASLLAQGLTLTEAAHLGVVVHAMAGDKAAEKGERGVLVSDLIDALHYLVNP